MYVRHHFGDCMTDSQLFYGPNKLMRDKEFNHQRNIAFVLKEIIHIEIDPILICFLAINFKDVRLDSFVYVVIIVSFSSALMLSLSTVILSSLKNDLVFTAVQCSSLATKMRLFIMLLSSCVWTYRCTHDAVFSEQVRVFALNIV